MNLQKVLFAFAALFISFHAFAQNEPEFSIALLENDNIAEVNINQDRFIEAFGKISDLSKIEFQKIDKSQKIAILLIAHKTGKPTIEFYSNPKISIEKEKQFLLKLKSQEIENTKLVDFPILMLINSNYDEYQKDFADLVSPVDQKSKEYKNANLKRQYELNIDYAREVLTVLAAYQVIVDNKYAGVKNFGKLVTETNFKEKQSIEELTSKNSNYWRAMMEMSVGNQLIPITKIFMLASQGSFDYSLKFIEIIKAYSDPKSVPDKYLNELAHRLDLFNNQLNKKIQEGFVYHDKGEYAKALNVYKNILDDYPNSAWAKYEFYFSQNALSLENKKIDAGDRSEWDKAKQGIYNSNPLYNMDVRASNGREGYLLFRRASISELFKSSKNRITDIYKYADIAMDLEVYDFAAQLFWISVTFDKNENDALYKFLYCLEKLEVKELKSNFKGDFEKEFKKIEKEKKKEMIESATFKAFKN